MPYGSGGGGSGSGTVTNVATPAGNGFAPVVTNPTASASIAMALNNLTGILKGTGAAVAVATYADLPVPTAGSIANSMLANAAVANLSGTNTGDQTNITGNAATVTTNANLTGVVTSVGNATSFATSPTFTGTLTCATLTASGVGTFSANGAASVSPVILTGTILTGGTATTNFPAFFVQPTGTTARTDFSTAGTLIGANGPAGFTGNLIDLSFNGASSRFFVTGGGALTCNGAILSGSSITASASLIAAAGSAVNWTGRSQMTSPSNGKILLQNSGATTFTALQFGGTTSSFPEIKVSGAAIAFRLADDSADAAITCAAITSSGAITTAAPSGGTAGAWKLGILVTAAVTPDTTRYVQFDVGGTLYKMIVST